MEQVIKLKDLTGTNISSRCIISAIRNKFTHKMIIDMSGIEFVTRSAADELCDAENEKELSFIHCSNEVRDMLSIVRIGRINPRNYQTIDIKDFNSIDCVDIKDLSVAFSDF